MSADLINALNADEITVLSRMASGHSTSSIATILSKTSERVMAIERSIFQKLNLVGLDETVRRTYAVTLYADYARAHGFTVTNAKTVSNDVNGNAAGRGALVRVNGQGRGRAAKVAGSVQREVAAIALKLNGLATELIGVARLIAEGKSNFDIAKAKDISVNEAGQLVSRLYAALGFARSLKKKRRILVKAAYAVAMLPKGAGGDLAKAAPPEDFAVGEVASNIDRLFGRKKSIFESLEKIDFKAGSDEEFANFAHSLSVGQVTLKSYLYGLFAFLHVPPGSRTERLGFLRRASAHRAGKSGGPGKAPADPPAAPKKPAVELSADDRAAIIANMDRAKRGMIAEIVYAGDAGYAQAARTLEMSTEDLLAGMDEVMQQLGLQVLSSARTQRALKEAWTAYRALADQQKPIESAPSAATAGPEKLHHELRDPETITDIRAINGAMNGNGQPSQSLGAVITAMRRKGYEPEAAVTIPGEHGAMQMQMILVQRLSKE